MNDLQQPPALPNGEGVVGYQFMVSDCELDSSLHELVARQRQYGERQAAAAIFANLSEGQYATICYQWTIDVDPFFPELRVFRDRCQRHTLRLYITPVTRRRVEMIDWMQIPPPSRHPQLSDVVDEWWRGVKDYVNKVWQESKGDE